MINQLEFENLSYQDFYEDKILLIEYDMTPIEMFKMGLNIELIKINNQTFSFWSDYIDRFMKYDASRYVFDINFSLEPYDNFNKLNSIIENKLINGWSYKQHPEFLYYRHPILLSWEELTDKSYLNFIIQSSINYKNSLQLEIFKKLRICEEIIDQKPIQRLNIIAVGKNSRTKIVGRSSNI